MHKVHIHIRPPQIHWRLYFTRKVITLVGVIIVLEIAAYLTHVHYFGRGGEFALGTLLEHCIFGVPFEEG
jgi:hypothetical protein